MFALQGGVDGADGKVFLLGLTVGIQELVRLSTLHKYVLCCTVSADAINCGSRAAPEPSPYFVRASEKPAGARRPPSTGAYCKLGCSPQRHVRVGGVFDRPTHC
jgi:hypothetical protein